MTIREVRLSALSATMESATLLEWKVAPGDTVQEGQSIAEVATDKVDMDLESPFGGTVRELLAQPGDEVPLGGVLATIESDAVDLLGGLDLHGSPSPEDTDDDADVRAPDTEHAVPPSPPGAIVPAAPPARKRARELGIDLRGVRPTGNRGQITSADLERHLADPGASSEPAPRMQPEPAQRVPDARGRAIRTATATIMERSAAIPQFTLWRTLTLDRAASTKGPQGWTTVFVRGLAAALREHPELNQSWDAEHRHTVPFDHVAVGVAVDRPGVGLVVTTIVDPDLPDPAAAEAAVRASADRARSGKLIAADWTQASITLSNLGGLGVDRFNALLFPPQAAILSMGTIKPRLVGAADGSFKSSLTCEVGLTIDHRVADGADGARFLGTLARLLDT